MPRLNKRKAQFIAAAENAREAKRLSTQLNSASTTDAREWEESDGSDDSEYLAAEEEPEPTEAEWKDILNVMKRETDTIRYARGPKENRVTAWRHKTLAKEHSETVKDCPRITSFFAVSWMTSDHCLPNQD